MSEFLKALRTGPVLADGAIGSYLFERTGRLSEKNHVYEALNVTDPDSIREVHFAYLQSGARCLTTNTFGANRTQLDVMGEAGRTQELNRAGVRLARQAIESFRQQTAVDQSYFVLGSIGPLRDDEPSLSVVRDVYREQVEALVDAGADALQAETFNSLAHVETLLEVIRNMPEAPPVIVQMAVHELPNGCWNLDPREIVETAARCGATVVGANCGAPWEASAFIEAVADLESVAKGRVLLSAMPNAGGFHRIGHRYMTDVNPEFMGKLARTLGERGVRLIGGCCEVHPAHIGEMNNYLQGRQAGRRAIEVVTREALAPAGVAEKRGNGSFSAKILSRRFAVSVEMLPSRGTAPTVLTHKIEFVKQLADSGLADALDVTDGSRGIPLVPPGDFIATVRNALNWIPGSGDELELIPHFTTRDLNVMGLQSRLMGYFWQHIHNVIFVTGDPPKMSPTYPRSSAVFDADSVGMVNFTHRCLNAGVDFGGKRLGLQDDPRTHFTIGTGFEPEALDSVRELRKLDNKIGGGADYVMTQPAFRRQPLAVLEPYRERIPILVGVMILTGLEHAKRVGQVPGVTIPDAVYERLAAFSTPADQARVGRDIAIEQIRWIKASGWSGLYLMSPSSHRPILDVLGAA
jgi:homocysteine S-methyltransferase